jgi:hypothetical protein
MAGCLEAAALGSEQHRHVPGEDLSPKNREANEEKNKPSWMSLNLELACEMPEYDCEGEQTAQNSVRCSIPPLSNSVSYASLATAFNVATVGMPTIVSRSRLASTISHKWDVPDGLRQRPARGSRCDRNDVGWWGRRHEVEVASDLIGHLLDVQKRLWDAIPTFFASNCCIF